MRERLLGGFHLGEFHIEPHTGKVTGHGGVRHLPPKAVEVLLCLAARPTSPVLRDELLRAVWGEAGSQEALGHAVRELRQVLEDPANAPRFIQTLPKLGYRLLVEPSFAPAAGAPAQRTTDAGEGRRRGFLAELKRRGVVETGVGYLVAGWVLIQVAAVTFNQLALPHWMATFVTYLVIVGFPIALVLAWFIRITARGAVLDLDADAIPERESFSRPYVAILGALLLASIGVVAYDRYVGLPVQVAASVSVDVPIEVDPNSIAVLPFLSIGGGEEGRVFSDGLAEDVIDRLSKVPGLKVASRGDAFSMVPNSVSQDVRRRLRVAYYLEGSVRVAGDAMRVVVQLINSADGFHIISRSFDRKRSDFFAIQDEITSLTVANLRVVLPPETQSAVEIASDDASLDAYLLYRRGTAALHKPMTRETIDEALDAFNRALSVDHDYAAAYAGICMAYSSGYRVTSDPDFIADAEQSCGAALKLNANLDVVHNALGELYLQTGRYEDAEAAFGQALAINNKAVSALIGLGSVYSRQHRLTEAEAKLRLAIGLQPGNWNAYNALGGFLYVNGRYGEAAAEYREIVGLDEGNMTGWTNLGASLSLSGDLDEAIAAFERAIEIEPTATAYSNLGMLQYYRGRIDQAVLTLRKAVELAPNDFEVWSNLGDVLSFSATPEEARPAFERAETLAASELRINSRDPIAVCDLAWIKAMLGKMEEAQDLVARAREIAPGDPYVYYTDALILVRRGDESAALTMLETAVEMGYPLALMAAEPHLTALRSESRFQTLIGEGAR